MSDEQASSQSGDGDEVAMLLQGLCLRSFSLMIRVVFTCCLPSCH